MPFFGSGLAAPKASTKSGRETISLNRWKSGVLSSARKRREWEDGEGVAAKSEEQDQP